MAHETCQFSSCLLLYSFLDFIYRSVFCTIISVYIFFFLDFIENKNHGNYLISFVLGQGTVTPTTIKMEEENCFMDMVEINYMSTPSIHLWKEYTNLF